MESEFISKSIRALISSHNMRPEAVGLAAAGALHLWINCPWLAETEMLMPL